MPMDSNFPKQLTIDLGLPWGAAMNIWFDQLACYLCTITVNIFEPPSQKISEVQVYNSLSESITEIQEGEPIFL